MPFMNKKNLLNCKVSSFEVVSVVLFSALTLGGGMAFAQTGSSVSNNNGACAHRAVGLRHRRAAGPHRQEQRASGLRACRRQSRRSSSRAEARQLPVISQRFEEIDSDRNGQLSRAEFDKGAQQY
jgi:hypothetical protein